MANPRTVRCAVPRCLWAGGYRLWQSVVSTGAPLDFARGKLHAERRDLLSPISGLSEREGLSARPFGPWSRRRESLRTRIPRDIKFVFRNFRYPASALQGPGCWHRQHWGCRQDATSARKRRVLGVEPSTRLTIAPILLLGEGKHRPNLSINQVIV